MTVTETLKEAVGLDGSSGMASKLRTWSLLMLCSRASLSPGHVGRETAIGIPRQLRSPSHPFKSMSVQRVLSAVEMCGRLRLARIVVNRSLRQ